MSRVDEITKNIQDTLNECKWTRNSEYNYSLECERSDYGHLKFAVKIIKNANGVEIKFTQDQLELKSIVCTSNDYMFTDYSCVITGYTTIPQLMSIDHALALIDIQIKKGTIIMDSYRNYKRD